MCNELKKPAKIGAIHVGSGRIHRRSVPRSRGRQCSSANSATACSGLTSLILDGIVIGFRHWIQCEHGRIINTVPVTQGLGGSDRNLSVKNWGATTRPESD
jgi:hypothetical protein